MDLEEVKQTQTWNLYEKGRNYNRLVHLYTDTDRNYRMYNGDQWAGAKLGNIEPVQLNIIKPIVRYKVGIINSNLYIPVYSADNFDNNEFKDVAVKTCELLNKYALKVWEKDNMDYKVRSVSKRSAINDEGIFYVDYNEELNMPVNEIIAKNDIYYGNENDSDIQRQPYIIIKKRMPIIEVIKLAQRYNVSDKDINYIIGDNDTFEESGESAKEEIDDMCTVLTKLYKEKGTVHFSRSTRYVDIQKTLILD